MMTALELESRQRIRESRRISEYNQHLQITKVKDAYHIKSNAESHLQMPDDGNRQRSQANVGKDVTG